MIDDSSQHHQSFSAATEVADEDVFHAASPAAKPSVAPEAAAPQPAEKVRAPLTTADLQAVINVPVRLRAVLGRARMDLSRLLQLAAGEVIELDRCAGEPVDIFINDRFAARGEVVLIDNVLGVTLTEIVRQDR